jgi:hypothetical protein
MQTTPLPEIDESDLKAARDFLLGPRDAAERPVRVPRASHGLRAAVPVRNGIARARTRPGSKAEA